MAQYSQTSASSGNRLERWICHPMSASTFGKTDDPPVFLLVISQRSLTLLLILSNPFSKATLTENSTLCLSTIEADVPVIS